MTLASAPARPRRRRHWLRWTMVVTAALVLLMAGIAAAAVRLQPVVAPLALPAGAAPPAGPEDGDYQVAPGSTAGFRIRQTVIGMHSDVVGRTGDVTGTMTIRQGRIVDARLRVGLLALTSGRKKTAPQFATSLETGRYPDADMALTQPVALPAAFASGTAVTAAATGTFTLHGGARTVTAALTIRRTGADIGAAGSVPVRFADYGIAPPKGYGAFGSLADHGMAEFLVLLHRG